MGQSSKNQVLFHRPQKFPDLVIPEHLALGRRTWVASGLLSPGLWVLSLEVLCQERPTEARPGRDGDSVACGEEGGKHLCSSSPLPRAVGPSNVSGKTDDLNLNVNLTIFTCRSKSMYVYS